MRIALITHQFFPRFYTGVERLALNLATQLRRVGHDCVVVTEATHSSGTEEAYVHEGTIVRAVERRAETDLARPWSGGESVESRVGRILDEERIELVHVVHPIRLPEAFDAAFRRRLPVVAHITDFGFYCSRLNLLRPDGSRCAGAARGENCVSACGVPNGSGRFEWGLRLLERTDAVICPSRATAARYETEGFDTSGWHVIVPGIDYTIHDDRAAPAESGPLTVGYLGTLLAHKGPHVFVEAVRRVESSNIRGLVYGESFHEGGYERELRRLAADDPRIELPGRYDHDELGSILGTLHLVVIPSLWHENLPQAGLQAIAAGVPLAVSDLPGLTELLDDYDCGFSFPPGDAAALGRLFETLASDPELLQTKRGMPYPSGVEEEAWRVEQIYESLVRKKALIA